MYHNDYKDAGTTIKLGCSDWYAYQLTYEGRILLSGSSQGESSVMRVRLEGHKKPITNTH